MKNSNNHNKNPANNQCKDTPWIVLTLLAFLTVSIAAGANEEGGQSPSEPRTLEPKNKERRPDQIPQKAPTWRRPAEGSPIPLEAELIVPEQKKTIVRQPPVVIYLSNQGLNELVGCSWRESLLCYSHHQNSGALVEPDAFFSETDSTPFLGWKNLVDLRGTYLNSHEAKYYHWNQEIFHWIYRADMESPYSAVLLQADGRGSLKAAFQIRKDKRDIEYRSILERKGTGSRDLIQISSARIQKLVECKWGHECDQRFYEGQFVENRLLRVSPFLVPEEWGRDVLEASRREIEVLYSRWIDSVSKKWTKGQEYGWRRGDITYLLYHPDPESFTKEKSKLFLLELTSSKLTGVFRILTDGTEVEYRTTYEEPELPLARYRYRRFEHQGASTHFEDLTQVRFIYLDAAQVQAQFGVSWDALYPEIERAMVRSGFELHDPGQFMETNWNMPTWKHTLQMAEREGRLTRGAWSYGDSTFYLFSDTSHSKVRIFEIDSSEKTLQHLREYHRTGEVSVVSSVKRRVEKVLRPPVWLYGPSDGTPSQATWGESLSSLQAQPTGVAGCDAQRSLVPDDPADFFATRGRAFRDWTEQINRLRQNHQLTYDTDQSWVGEEGHVFLLRRDSCWQAEHAAWDRPRWQVLEFEEDGLLRVHSYDSLWRESVYEQFVDTPLSVKFGETLEERSVRARNDSEILDGTISILEQHIGKTAKEALSLKTLEGLKESRAIEDQLALNLEETRRYFLKMLGLAIVLLAVLGTVAIRRRLQRRARQRQQARGQEMGFDG